MHVCDTSFVCVSVTNMCICSIQVWYVDEYICIVDMFRMSGGIFGLFDGRVSEFLKSQPENAVCTLESLLAIEK